MSKRKDFTGHRHGFMTVTRFGERRGVYNYWYSMCDCGTEKLLRTDHLNRVKSCGCQTGRIIAESKTTHGMTGTPIYSLWRKMMERCYSEADQKYPRYGGRGIKVCKRWHKFENFLKDMGERPEGRSLDRVNNDGNYSWKNCRWSTYKEQANNRHNSVATCYPWEVES